MTRLTALLIILILMSSILGLATSGSRPEASAPFDDKLALSEDLEVMALSGGAVFQNGADRLAGLQNNDGGWDWPLYDGNPAKGSLPSTVGPIAKGLAEAYVYTRDPDHKAALKAAGAFLLAKKNNFSPSDGYLAAALDEVFGVKTYTGYVRKYFYGPLAAGTYVRKGAVTRYNTARYVNWIRTTRASQGDPNLAAWDLGMGLVGAASAGADTTAWIAGVKAEINELNGRDDYDVLGLAGAIYGLAYVGKDYDPKAGAYASASSLADLGRVLAGYQLATGGFTWNSYNRGKGQNKENIQATVYAILALAELDRTAYLNTIQAAADYIESVQLGTGGWKNRAGEGENNQSTGEALWGIATAYPPPVAEANGPYSGYLSSPIPIAGSASDPDGDQLNYIWSSNSSVCYFADPNTLSTNVTCTDIGYFTLTLKVSDGIAEVTDAASLTVIDEDLTRDINDCVPGSYEHYQFVETLFVPAYGSGGKTPVVSSNSLDAGGDYKIEASGVYYAGGNDLFYIRADARYSQDRTQRINGLPWTDLVNNYEGYGEGLLELKVDDAFVEWGAYNPSHVYTLDKPGSGIPSQFQIYDIDAQTNMGGLCASLFMFVNTPPIAEANGPYIVAAGESIDLDHTGSNDPDGDPLSYAWAVIDPALGTITNESFAAGNVAGITEVTLTVDDGWGGTVTDTARVIVYDPSGGFVTGGGWIDSPAGAYKPDPTLEGKANFGFVTMYEKGADEPTGNTEFQFKAGDLNFHSTSFDWLVVTGSNYAQFKGAGTINGGLGPYGNAYKFMIWAGDNEPDTFHIRIWYEEGENEIAVYDTGGDQAIGGGSIVIHKAKE